jgi:hypothetical protein
MDAAAAVVHGVPHAGFDPVPAARGASLRAERPRPGESTDGASRVGIGTRGIVTVKPNSISDLESADVQPGVAPLGDQRDGSNTTPPDPGRPIVGGRIEPEATVATPGEDVSSLPAISEDSPVGPVPIPKPSASEESLLPDEGQLSVPPSDPA